MSQFSNIVLAGFMGTGKTTVGKLIAAQTNLIFIDTDSVIEAEANKTIAEIFIEHGEAAFRDHEAQVCQRLAAEPGRVIATGGGTLLNPETRAAFEASSMIVCLTATLDEIMQRVGTDPLRPLFGQPDEVAQRLAERTPLYHGLPFQVDTTGKTPQSIAEEIITLWHNY